MTTKKREPKTTREQFQIYVEHMRRHEKLRTFTDASDEATKLWRNLTTVLNSIDGAPTRTVEHWMMTFKKWKIACRFQLRWLEHPSTAGSLLDTSKRNSMSDLPDVMQQALRLWQEMDNIPDAASVEKTKITSTEFVDVERGGADANRLPEIDTETDVDNSNVPISQQSVRSTAHIELYWIYYISNLSFLFSPTFKQSRPPPRTSNKCSSGAVQPTKRRPLNCCTKTIGFAEPQ